MAGPHLDKLCKCGGWRMLLSAVAIFKTRMDLFKRATGDDKTAVWITHSLTDIWVWRAAPRQQRASGLKQLVLTTNWTVSCAHLQLLSNIQIFHVGVSGPALLLIVCTLWLATSEETQQHTDACFLSFTLCVSCTSISALFTLYLSC